MLSETETQVVTNAPSIQSAFNTKHRARRRWLVAVIVFLAVARILVFGIFRRVRAQATVSAETTAMAGPLVHIVSPKRTPPPPHPVLPRHVEPYMTAPI